MNKPLNILFITNNYTPYSGGLVSSIQASVDELRLQGHNPSIATLDFLGDRHKDPVGVYRLPCPIRFIYKSNHMALPWRATHHLTKLMQDLSPDIVHVHHPFLLGVAGLASARSLNIPVVFTYHTMYEKYAHYVPLVRELAAPFIQHKVLKFCKRVDGIIAPSIGVQDFLRQAQVQVPIASIPSGLRSQFLKCERNFDVQRSEGPFRLLYVGRLTKEKNIPFLLDLFAQLPREKFSLTLVGYGVQAGQYEQYAFEKLRLDKRYVRFMEKPENVAKFYAQSDLFVFPSQTDTQGIVLAESLSQGLPIAALDGCGQRDAIIEGQNGCIVPNQAAMISVIERIAADPVLHRALCAGARESATRYAPREVVDRLVNFYRKIMEKNG